MMSRYVWAVLVAAAAPAGTALAHADHVDRAAWTACESATLADACTYTDLEANVYRGSCRLMSDTLLCVRSSPIERHDADHGIPG